MNGTGPQDPGRTASLRPSREDPADLPTVISQPASSGIGLALGPEKAIVTEPEDFIHELTDSGLMEPDEAAEHRRRFSEAGDPPDARAISRELVRSGRLTPYQAAAVLQGKTKGLLIGGYLVLDRLGAGSMGIVLKARHRQLGRVVALKLLPPSLARNPSAVARFHREAHAAARLSHPNVVSVLDADQDRGLHFLVMEYVEGADLSRLVRDQGPMEVPRAVDGIIQAARGLQAAYDAKVVHRDIKPSNLLLDPGGTLKILDMGVARLGIAEGLPGATGADASLTESNVLVGTVDYMSPEQASNPKLADHRSDIYSLGCTLHYLLTGRPPYTGDTFMERLWAHRERPIPSLSEARPDVPEPLDRLFRKMLSKSPEERVSSLEDLINELRVSLEEPAASPTPGPPPALPAAPSRITGADVAVRSGLAARSRTTWLIGAGAAAIAGLLVMGVLLTRQRAEHDVPIPVEPPTPAPAVSSPPVVPPEVTHREENELAKAVSPEAVAPAAGAPTAVAVEPPPKAQRKPVAVGLIRELRGHQGRVNGVAASADGSRALSAGQDGSVRLWDLAGGAPLLRLDHDGPVTCVGMTPDGLIGISGSLDRSVRVWSLRPDRSVGLHRLEGHAGPVFALAFGPDQRLVLSGGGDRTVRVWDLQTGRPDGQPLAHESAVVAMAVTGGGSVLAACEDGTLWQWDLKSRQRLRRLLAGWPILCLALSPDGHQALSGHPDGNLILWNLDLGTEIGRMSDRGDYVRSVAFTPDGRRAMAGSQQEMLVLWDIELRSVDYRFQPPPGLSEPAGQMDVAVLADGLHALTGGADGIVRLWGLPATVDATADARGVADGRR